MFFSVLGPSARGSRGTPFPSAFELGVSDVKWGNGTAGKRSSRNTRRFIEEAQAAKRERSPSGSNGENGNAERNWDTAQLSASILARLSSSTPSHNPISSLSEFRSLLHTDYASNLTVLTWLFQFYMLHQRYVRMSAEGNGSYEAGEWTDRWNGTEERRDQEQVGGVIKIRERRK